MALHSVLDVSFLCLEPGDVAGCNMVKPKRGPGHCFKSQVSLVAKVSSQVHLITWKDLAQVMQVYPEIAGRVMEQMELSCDLASGDMVSNYCSQTCACQEPIARSIQLPYVRAMAFSQVGLLSYLHVFREN